MQLQTLTCSLALASAILALPTATRTNTNTNNEQAPPLRATRTLDTRDSGVDLVIAIMPSSTSCAGRGDECVTADVAAPLLANGLAHYGVTTGVEQAGILALVAFESVEMQYKYNTNADAAAGGKGTSNQQSGGFNVEFANTFDELSGLGLTESNVLDYVTKNKYNFWTGPWYYKNHAECTSAREMASSGSSTAWEWFNEYVTVCVNAPALASEPGRVVYWNNALAAFGLTDTSIP